MSTRVVTILSVCLCLATLVTGQLSKGIDYDTDAIVDDETALDKWALMESRVRSLANEATKAILPVLMEKAGTVNISATCTQNGLKLITGLRKLKSWAIKFLDASAKSIDGIMGMKLASLGAYDECLDNKVINEKSGKKKGEVLFQGMYCRVELRPYLPKRPRVIHFTDRLKVFENITGKDTAIGEMADLAHLLYTASLVAGMCVPSGCSQHDVNLLLHEVGDYVGMVIKATRCEIKEEKEYTPAIIGVLTLYGVTLFWILVSTLVDIYCQYGKQKLESGSIKLLRTFSVISNFRKFVDTSSSSTVFSCLSGIRFLSLCWIVLTHTYLIMSMHMLSMPKNAEERIQEFAFQGIANGNFAVDTFFFMGGMVLCYGATKMMKIEKKPFNFTLFVVHRLWRLLPAYIFAIVFMFLSPIMGSGPLFHEVTDHFYESCRKNWWTNILFINNFYDSKNMCIPHAWYLAVDMQCYIGSLIILLPLMRSAKVGISLAVSFILAFMIGCAVHTYVSDLPVTALITPNIVDQDRRLREYSAKPHTHGAPYLIGILCGYLLTMYPKMKIPKVVQVLGWCLTVVMSFCVVNGVQKWNGGVTPTFWESMFYSSCNRVAWCLGMGWIVTACSTGHGGIVNDILSWKPFVPLGRLTFAAYLVHPLVMIFYFGNLRTIIHYEHDAAVWQFFGHFVVSYLIAFGVSMAIEAPFLSLEKVIFSKGKEKTDTDATNQDVNHTVEDPELPKKNEIISIPDLKDPFSVKKNGIPNSDFVYKL